MLRMFFFGGGGEGSVKRGCITVSGNNVKKTEDFKELTMPLFHIKYSPVSWTSEVSC